MAKGGYLDKHHDKNAARTVIRLYTRNDSGEGENWNSVRLLDATFFDRPAEEVAYDLIGCRLYWRLSDRSESRIITETEAYVGPKDLASHAARGRTRFSLGLKPYRFKLDHN